MSLPENVVDTDVLVIGGGFAGTWAAIRAKDFTENVILVDKGKIARSGCSTFAAGVLLCPLPGDNLKEWAEEMVERGEYLNDQDWVELLLHEHVERIKDMERWDFPFERDSQGEIVRIIGRAHIRTRMLMFHGKKLMEKMREQVLKKGVNLIERTMITGILTSDGEHPTQGQVVGAVGFNLRTQEFQIFRAKAVIVATGPASGKIGGGYTDGNTGDGTAMAFKTGAEVIGMEFCIRGDPVVWNKKYVAYGINMIQGSGAKFLNAKGERFMEKYAPLLKERARKAEICTAMCKEVLEGRGPIYCDMRNFSPETFERFRRVIPNTMRVFDAAGIDPSKQLVEYAPRWGVYSCSGEGGIRINLNCETNIRGLFSAGTGSCNPVQGSFSVGGVNLAFCGVSGYRAAETATRFALNQKEVKLQDDQVEGLKEFTLSPLHRKEGTPPDEIFETIQKVVTPAQYGVFKNEDRIRHVLSELEKANQLASNMLMAVNHHELVKSHEALNYLCFSELAFKAALERRESRGFHFREEYPERDDINWLKWIILKLEDNEVQLNVEAVPINRYPFKPTKFEKHPYPAPFFFGK